MRYRGEEKQRGRRSAEERQQRAWEKTVEEDRQRENARQKAQAKRQNERARMDCELLWVALAPVIEPQFDRTQLSAFFNAYMSDEHSPDSVEERAKTLKTTLKKLYGKAQPERKFQSIHDVVQRFDEAKREIKELHLEDPLMQDYLETELEGMMHEHLEQVIKTMGERS